MKDLYVRTSYRYSLAYADLDPHALLAQYHVLSRRVTQGNECYITTVRVKVKPHPDRELPCTPELIQEALSDAFSYSCRCEHDCCGHYQKYVSYICPARKKKSGAIVKDCYVLQVVALPNI